MFVKYEKFELEKTESSRFVDEVMTLYLSRVVLGVVLPVSVDDGEEVELEEDHTEESCTDDRLYDGAQLFLALGNRGDVKVFHSSLGLHLVAANNPGVLLEHGALYHVEGINEHDEVAEHVAEEEVSAV